MAKAWSSANSIPPNAIVQDALIQTAAESASTIFRALKDLARELAQTLGSTAQALGFNEVHTEDDLLSTIKGMPMLGPGKLKVDLHPSLLSKISAKLTIRHAERSWKKQIGPRVTEAFSSFGGLLNVWIRRTLSELQLKFESHADG